MPRSSAPPPKGAPRDAEGAAKGVRVIPGKRPGAETFEIEMESDPPPPRTPTRGAQPAPSATEPPPTVEPLPDSARPRWRDAAQPFARKAPSQAPSSIGDDGDTPAFGSRRSDAPPRKSETLQGIPSAPPERSITADLAPERPQSHRAPKADQSPTVRPPRGHRDVTNLRSTLGFDVPGPSVGGDTDITDDPPLTVRRDVPTIPKAVTQDLADPIPSEGGSSTDLSLDLGLHEAGDVVAVADDRHSSDPVAFDSDEQGDALDMVGRQPAGDSIQPSAPHKASDPMGELRDRYALGDFSGALDIAEKLMAAERENADVQRYAESCRDVLKQMYAARLGALDQIPSVAVPTEQLRWLTLDHRAGFLLSHVDGVSTLEEILDVSGMPQLDAMRILCDLVQQKVVVLG